MVFIKLFFITYSVKWPKIGLVLPEICPKTRFNMLYRFNKLNRFDKFNSKIKPVTGWTGLTRLTSLSTSFSFQGFQDFIFQGSGGPHELTLVINESTFLLGFV